MRKTNRSLAARLTLQIGVLAVLSLCCLSAIIMVATRSVMKEQIKSAARASAEKQAGEVAADLDRSAYTTYLLINAFQSMMETKPDRRTGDKLVRNLLEHNRNLMSVWCTFERNAFDGQDRNYTNSYLGNTVGRYAPAYDFAKGVATESINIEDELVPGTGDYYFIPKENGKDTLMDPYFYSYHEGTPEIFETSFATPFYHKGKFAGVAGVDITLDQLSEMVKHIKPYGDGYAMMVTDTGAIAAHPNKDLLGKNITDIKTLKAIAPKLKQQNQFEVTTHDPKLGTDMWNVFVPIKIRDADSIWWLSVSVPMNKAMAPVTRITWICILMVLTILILTVIVVRAVSHQIAEPIKRFSSIAHLMAEGDVEGASELMKV